MRFPNHDRLKQAIPDAMHTIKDVVERLVYFLTGKEDSQNVRKAEIEFGRFDLLPQPVPSTASSAANTRKRKKKSHSLPDACFRLTTTDVKLADSRSSSVILPSADFTPFNVFTKPSRLKSHDWKEVCS